MDLLNGSSSTTSYQQEVEPGSLLEECWFFENLLTCSKPKMSRCNSDPCPSTNFNARPTDQEQSLISIANASSTALIENENTKVVAPKLVRAPSLPSFMAVKTVQVAQQIGKHDSAEIRFRPQAVVPPPRNTLLRATSLSPPCVGRSEDDEEEEDQESEFRLGRLIRQASLKSSDTFLPPRQTPKSFSIARRHRKKIVVEGNKEMGNQNQIIKQSNKGKLPSDIQKKEVERLKALSSQFEKQSLENEVPTNKVAGLQEKSQGDQLEDKKFRRPYAMSDPSARPLMRSTTSIPKWAAAAAENDKRSSQDMKAQLKFWARAVASNARAPGVL